MYPGITSRLSRSHFVWRSNQLLLPEQKAEVNKYWFSCSLIWFLSLSPLCSQATYSCMMQHFCVFVPAAASVCWFLSFSFLPVCSFTRTSADLAGALTFTKWELPTGTSAKSLSTPSFPKLDLLFLPPCYLVFVFVQHWNTGECDWVRIVLGAAGCWPCVQWRRLALILSPFRRLASFFSFLPLYFVSTSIDLLGFTCGTLRLN